MVKVKKVEIDGYLLPVMTINLKNTSIISVPTQIGCMIDCSFCISKDSKFVRSLKSEEIHALINAGKEISTNDNFYISFTGEGEPFLNLKNINPVIIELDNEPSIEKFRICTSGIKPNLLKGIVESNTPITLQFSLHSPFDSKRNDIVPKTKNISDILNEIRKNQDRFDEVAINYVLIKDFNDSKFDLHELKSIVDKNWVIKLNPLLGDDVEQSENKDYFFNELKDNGYDVKNFKKIGSKISNGFYEQLTYEKSNALVMDSKPSTRKLKA